MNPIAVNRLAIAAAITATLVAIACATGGHHCSMSVPTPPPVAATEAATVSCDGASAEEVTTEEATATDEEPAAEGATAADEAPADDAEAEDSDEMNKVRQAARDFVKVAHPDSKTDGIFLLSLARNDLYLAGTDTTFTGGKRKTVDLLVRRYVRKTGGTYWRAESLDEGQAAMLRAAHATDAP